MVNYEEGSEQTYAMGDDVNEDLCDLPSEVEAQRDVAIESAYEYGSRAGIWRLFRVFAAAGVPEGTPFVSPERVRVSGC